MAKPAVGKFYEFNSAIAYVTHVEPDAVMWRELKSARLRKPAHLKRRKHVTPRLYFEMHSKEIEITGFTP